MAEAQSPSHGMRPLEDLLPHTEALRLILAACPPLNEWRLVPVGESVGQALAEDVSSPVDVPPFDRAAMDGYAVRAADTVDADRGAVALRVGAVLHAGQTLDRPVGPGECVQIATGAPVPAGADAVVPVEKTRMENGRVVLGRSVRRGEHVSRRGSDVALGHDVLREGSLINPARVAVAAAVGRDTLRVWRRPRVAVLSTGSELRPVGAPLREGEIHDSNGVALAALFRSHGADVVQAGPLADDLETLRRALRGHADQDVIVLSGASSAGERDVLRDAVAAEGRIVFHGVRVKPGKPLLLGILGRSVVIGLPGYPTSCLSDAYLFVLPALHQLAHRPPAPARRVAARISERVASVPGRLWFLPVRIERGLAVPTYKESGATTSLADAVGYVEVPPDRPHLEEGDPVDVVLF